MAEGTLINLVKLNDKERNLGWGDFENPERLLNWIVTRLFVSSDSFSGPEGIVAQPSVPSAVDNGKIWIKTGDPFGIGFFVDGAYQMIYQYPVDSPLLFPASKSLTSGFRLLTGEEISGYGLSAPTNGGKWVVFEAPDLS